MAENVFLFIPNLIGYSRIVLTLLSFYYMSFDHMTATWMYLLSSFLDEFDGYAARYFGQCSKFGAMLDQLTDRCATMCLLVTLSCLFPKYMFLFQMSMIIDIASHWLHDHSSLMCGNASHKDIGLNENPVLRLYYTNNILMFVLCMGNELFYCMLYLSYFTVGPVGRYVMSFMPVSVPLGVRSVGLFSLVCWLSAPIALVKSAISLVQLYVASLKIAAIDVRERNKFI